MPDRTKREERDNLDGRQVRQRPAAPNVERETRATVKVELDRDEEEEYDYDGTYACVICTESVRGTAAALHCATCSSNPFHQRCVAKSRFADTCPQCAGKIILPWSGGRNGGIATCAAQVASIDLTTSCSAFATSDTVVPGREGGVGGGEARIRELDQELDKLQAAKQLLPASLQVFHVALCIS